MRAFFNILWLVLTTGTGLAALDVAAAAFNKAHDATVVGAGFAHDYMGLAQIMAGTGAVLLAIAVASLIYDLHHRPSPPPPVDHF